MNCRTTLLASLLHLFSVLKFVHHFNTKCSLLLPGKLSVKPNQPMGRLPSHTDAVSFKRARTHSTSLLSQLKLIIRTLNFVMSASSFRFQMKFYFICQLGYWLHALPELYFQKTKKVSVCARMCMYVCVLVFGPRGCILFDFLGYAVLFQESSFLFFISVYKNQTPVNILTTSWHPVLFVYCLGGYSTPACVHLPVPGPHCRRLHSEVSLQQ